MQRPQIRIGQHRVHAGSARAAAASMRAQPRMRHRAAHEGRMEHVREVDVVDEAPGAAQQPHDLRGAARCARESPVLEDCLRSLRHLRPCVARSRRETDSGDHAPRFWHDRAIVARRRVKNDSNDAGQLFTIKTHAGRTKVMADDKIKHAAHWLARFTVNGVAASDFYDVLGSLERWDDWCSAWSKRAAVHEELGREALAGAPFRQRRRAFRPRRRHLPFRQISVRQRHGADARRPPARRRMSRSRAAPSRSAGRARADPV